MGVSRVAKPARTAMAQPDLFRYATIQQQLETVFHRHVDLISAHAHLPESFQARLEQEAIYV